MVFVLRGLVVSCSVARWAAGRPARSLSRRRDTIGTALGRLPATLASLTTQRQIDSRLPQSAAGVSLAAGTDSNSHVSALPWLRDRARHLSGRVTQSASCAGEVSAAGVSRARTRA